MDKSEVFSRLRRARGRRKKMGQLTVQDLVLAASFLCCLVNVTDGVEPLKEVLFSDLG